jgi:di/tricarboxylate transporter
MTLEIAVVLALIVVALILFTLERIGVDVAALIIMAFLLLSGIVSPREGLAGFSNPATVTIGAMFILSEGLTRTGALSRVGQRLTALGRKNYWAALSTLMLTVGVISAFINNTAAVAIFLPIVMNMSRQMQVSASRILMPLSFASMFGGVCTLVGTSTNILVDSIAQEAGFEPFGVFEFAPLGLIYFAVGFAYLYYVGPRLIPDRRAVADLTETFRMKNYLTDVILLPNSEAIGRLLDNTGLVHNLDLDILQVFRSDDREPDVEGRRILEAHDVIRIRGRASEINKLTRREDVALLPSTRWKDPDLEVGADMLVEAVVAPNSALVGKKIGSINFPEQYGATVLAIRHHGELQRESLPNRRLSGGDELLLKIHRERVTQLRQNPAFIIVSQIETPVLRREKIPIALGIIGAVVGLAAFGVFPIVVSAVAGVVVMILTGCITTEEAYDAIQWEIIFLLAGVLSLGAAMNTSGAAALLSKSAIDVFATFGPHAMLSGLFFITMLMTNIISNAAAAALLAPVALQMAAVLGVDPRPFLMGVTYAASLSFMTPVGYQTNTMIYGPGQYKFTDFTKVGTPLNILFWIIGTLLIPFFWPF